MLIDGNSCFAKDAQDPQLGASRRNAYCRRVLIGRASSLAAKASASLASSITCQVTTDDSFTCPAHSK